MMLTESRANNHNLSDQERTDLFRQVLTVLFDAIWHGQPIEANSGLPEAIWHSLETPIAKLDDEQRSRFMTELGPAIDMMDDRVTGYLDEKVGLLLSGTLYETRRESAVAETMNSKLSPRERAAVRERLKAQLAMKPAVDGSALAVVIYAAAAFATGFLRNPPPFDAIRAEHPWVPEIQ